MTVDDGGLARLQQRLERERRARRQAEIIAERGMRELWEANSELQERVSTRTADLERAARIAEYRHRARLSVLAQLADSARDALESAGGDGRAQLTRICRLIADGAPPASPATTRRPVDVADEVVDAWQHVAARSGLLLSVEIDGDERPLRLDWAAALASLNVVLDGCVRCSSPGGLAVSLASSVEGVSVRVVAAGLQSEPPLGDRSATSASAEPGSLADDLAMARVIVEWAGGSLDVGTSDAETTVELAVPAVGEAD